MAQGMPGNLGEDHFRWLLAAAYNELCQRRADRARILLELLRILDPDNLQCMKMLAYAYWCEGDLSLSTSLIDGLLGGPLSEEDRTAIETMRLRFQATPALDATPNLTAQAVPEHAG